MALAAGSMFHEQVIQAECDESPVFVARRALNQFEWAEAAGCIVITNEKNEPLSVMYFAERTLVGAQLLTSEKAPQEMTKLWQYLEFHPKAKVYASMLSTEMIDAPGLTFSLSGLDKGAPTTEVGDEFAFHEVAKLTIMHVMRTPKEIQPVSLNRFVNINKFNARPGQPKINQRFRGVGFYYVDPR